jgi:hypothetical protein
MGTRADFYVGQGKDAEWIGSISWDGYPDAIADEVLQAIDADSFRAAVASFFSSRTDVTLPEHGWPWPWNDSGTTDYSYWHFDGKTMGSSFGRALFPCDEEPEEQDDFKSLVMPDMTDRKNVAIGSRSGLIVIGA